MLNVIKQYRKRLCLRVSLILSSVSLQLIQTISAVDTDEPLVGHKFVFSISATNPNFTIVDREGKIHILKGRTKQI